MVQSAVTISNERVGCKKWGSKNLSQKTLTFEDWSMISYQKRRAWSGLKLFEVHGNDKAFRFFVSLGEQSPPM